MVWVKLDDGMPSRPEILDLSDAAFRLFVSGLCYIGKHLTDGAISAAAVLTLGVRQPKRAVSELIDAGLWQKTDTGYFVPDFLSYNLSREVVERKRAETRDRVQRYRGRNSVTGDVTNAVTNGVSNTSPVPSRSRSRKDQERTAADAAADERFERFWAVYPNKVKKPAALKAWTRINPDGATTDAIIAGVERETRSRQWTKDDGEYIPHPATWLNQRQWEDNPVAAVFANQRADHDAEYQRHADERFEQLKANRQREDDARAAADEIIGLLPADSRDRLHGQAVDDVKALAMYHRMSEESIQQAIASSMRSLVRDKYRGPALFELRDRLRAEAETCAA